MAHLRPFQHPANALSASRHPGTDAAPSPTPVVRIRGLRTRLGNTTVFDGIDLDIPAGSVVAIMGPSGTLVTYYGEDGAGWTKEQIDDIARYIVKSGVKIVSSSERETVIE